MERKSKSEEIKKRPKRKMKVGFNVYTSSMVLKKPISEEENYQLFSNKTGRLEF